jgi:anthranilate/para-aminobenzoate synthase component I
MKDILKQLLSGIEVHPVGYGDACQNIKPAENSLYIPRWPFLKNDQMEISVSNFLFLIESLNQKTILRSAEQTISQKHFSLEAVLDFLELEAQSLPQEYMYFILLSFDYGSEKLINSRAKPFYPFPDYFILFPAAATIVNHTLQKAWSVKTASYHDNQLQTDKKKMPNALGGAKSESKQNYLKKIEQVRDLIFEGEVYQLNYTQRFSHIWNKSAYSFFKKIDAINPAPFSALIKLPHFNLISNSPERFFYQNKETILSEPIKGTIKRLADETKDKEQIKILKHSEKDKAELSMIVDLIRNDLSKISIPGTVKVLDHLRIESFNNVHHLVSAIQGTLIEKTSLSEMINALFPGGSISGCPKIAALHYIKKLEVHNRSFYTGSLFLRKPATNQTDSNILIRTALHFNKQNHFQAGGGIVIDSDAEAEYLECLAKADSFFKAING